MTKGVVIDTNLLLLLLIGCVDKTKITRSKRTNQFDEIDFEMLRNFVQKFCKIIVTPQILAELTNLLDNKTEDPVLLSAIKTLLNAPNAQESYYKKEDLINDPFLLRLGFTDISILLIAKKRKALVLTDDLPLWSVIHNCGGDVLNWNEIRVANWSFQ